MFINFTEDKPIFIQIADWIEDAVLSGIYKEEEQVPSITEFSVYCRINPATALKGINILVDNGILYKKRGTGMFVAPGATDKLRAKRRDQFYEDYIVKLVEEARKLEIEKGEVIKMIERGFKNDRS